MFSLNFLISCLLIRKHSYWCFVHNIYSSDIAYGSCDELKNNCRDQNVDDSWHLKCHCPFTAASQTFLPHLRCQLLFPPPSRPSHSAPPHFTSSSHHSIISSPCPILSSCDARGALCLLSSYKLTVCFLSLPPPSSPSLFLPSSDRLVCISPCAFLRVLHLCFIPPGGFSLSNQSEKNSSCWGGKCVFGSVCRAENRAVCVWEYGSCVAVAIMRGSR